MSLPANSRLPGNKPAVITAQSLGCCLDFGPATVLGSPAQSGCCCSPEPSERGDMGHSWRGGEEAETSWRSDLPMVM